MEYEKSQIPEYDRLSFYNVTLHLLCFLYSKVPHSLKIYTPVPSCIAEVLLAKSEKCTVTAFTASYRHSKEGKAVSNSPHGAVTTHDSVS